MACAVHILHNTYLLCATDIARVPGTWRRVGLAVCKLAYSDHAGSVQGVDVHR